MSTGFNIGDVGVHWGEPPGGNPYRVHSLMGNERWLALTNFKNGEDTTGYTFWYSPCCGGAERITDPTKVNWETMGPDYDYRKAYYRTMPGDCCFKTLVEFQEQRRKDAEERQRQEAEAKESAALQTTAHELR